MPLYEFACKSCAHRFERIMKFADPLPTVCPECAEPALEQCISAPAVQFKGAGWYVTDYARKSSTPASSAPRSESADASAGSAPAAPASPPSE